MGALYQVRRQQDPVNSLPWSDPKSNPLKDIQDAIAHYASDEVLRQNLEIECLLREAIPLYSHPIKLLRLHIVYQDGCSPAVASVWMLE